MNLTTERLLIRNLQPNDLADFHSYRSNPEVTKYQGFDVMNQEQAASFIDKMKDKAYGTPGEWVQYAIIDTQRQQLVGDCAIHIQQADNRMVEVGMTISHNEQKKGYAREAFIAILKFLFEKQNIHRVVETVDAENIASINLLKSVGFREEGYFIENIFFKGKWGSEYQYAMLQKEWKALNS
jgi:ribosomal-protein-alanine N-acetyltransferase